MNHIIFEKGYNIYRLESVVGTREGYASVRCNKNNLDNFYNKTRFLLLCGVNQISKSYTVEEIVSHYPDSSKIAIYNYISGVNKVISYKDKIFDNDDKWLPIYHSISEKQLKELEKNYQRNREEHSRLLMELQTSTRSSILSKITEIENLYKTRFEDGFAASNKQPLGLFKIKQEINEELYKFDDPYAKTKFISLLNNYELKLDSYYLAMHRNLPEFIEIKEKEIVRYKNEMVEILNNLTINHL